MTVTQAIDWIIAHKAMYGDAPGYFNKPEEWTVLAGKLCKDSVVNNGKPVQDSTVDSAYGGEFIPRDVDF